MKLKWRKVTEQDQLKNFYVPASGDRLTICSMGVYQKRRWHFTRIVHTTFPAKAKAIAAAEKWYDKELLLNQRQAREIINLLEECNS